MKRVHLRITGRFTTGPGVLSSETLAFLSEGSERESRRAEMSPLLGAAYTPRSPMFDDLPLDEGDVYSLAQERSTRYLGVPPALLCPYGGRSYLLPETWPGLSAKEQWSLKLKGGERAPRGCRALKYHRALISGLFGWFADSETGMQTWRRKP